MPKYSKKHVKSSRKKKDTSTPSSASSSSSSCSTREKRDCKSLRRGVAISKIPFVRLQGMLATAEERLDHAWTAGMTTDLITMLLWLVTKIRPDSMTSKLGVKTYKAAQKQCRNARSREFTIMGEQRYEQLIGELLRAGQLEFEDVAMRHGFQSAWLPSSKRSKAKAKSRVADTSIEALERQLRAAKRRNGTAEEGLGSQGQDSGGDSGTTWEMMGDDMRVMVPATALAPAQGNLRRLDSGIQSLPETPPAEREVQPEAAGGTALVPATALAPPPGNPRRSDSGARPPTVGVSQATTAPPQPVTPPSEPAATGTSVTFNRNFGGIGSHSPTTPPETTDAVASLTQSQLDTIAANRARAAAKRQARSAAEGSTQGMRVVEVEDADQDPTGGPCTSAGQPTAGSETPPDREEHLCVICQNTMLPSEDRQALPCMHLFHTHCIETYVNCKGQPIDKCCPFKCNVSEPRVVMVEDEVAITNVAEFENTYGSTVDFVLAARSSAEGTALVQVALQAVEAAAREVD